MSQRRGFERADRVGQQIHEMVGKLFVTEIKDPRLQQVEITDVDLAPDLRNAKIFYTLRGDDSPTPELEEALDGVTGFVHGHLAQELDLKYVPDVDFRFDKAMERGRRIDELLSDLHED